MLQSIVSKRLYNHMKYDDDVQNPASTATAVEAVLRVVDRHPEMVQPLLKANQALEKRGSEIAAVTPHKHDDGFDVHIQEDKDAPQVAYGEAGERKQNFKAALAEAERAVEGAKSFMAAKGIDCAVERARSGLGGEALQAKLSCDIKR